MIAIDTWLFIVLIILAICFGFLVCAILSNSKIADLEAGYLAKEIARLKGDKDEVLRVQ